MNKQNDPNRAPDPKPSFKNPLYNGPSTGTPKSQPWTVNVDLPPPPSTPKPS